MHKRVSRDEVEEVKLFYKSELVLWSCFFKYLGSLISGSEGISFLEDSLVTSAAKVSGAVRSACRSAVALPTSRAVSLFQSLVTPIATLNCIAWFPLLQHGGPWFSEMCDQWFWILGFRPRPSKEYVLLSWLNFNTWEITASKMVFKFLVSMTRAPRGSFLAELLAELRADCNVNPKAWLFGALKILSKGLTFQRADCLLARVDFMLGRIRQEPVALLFHVFTENLENYIYRAARERLAAIPRGPYRKLRLLQGWVGQEGDPPPRFLMKAQPYSLNNFRYLVLLMLGELPVQRTNVFYKYSSKTIGFS